MPSTTKGTKGFIKHPKALAAIKKFWNSFPEGVELSAIVEHLKSEKLPVPRATITNYLNDHTSYGDLSIQAKKDLRLGTKAKLVKKSQRELLSYINENAYKFDDVDKFEQEILTHFDKPKYRGTVPAGKAGTVVPGSKMGFLYDSPKFGKGLRLEGFHLPQYKKLLGPITESAGFSYKTTTVDNTGVKRETGQFRNFRQMLAMAIADKNPAVRKKVKEAVEYSQHKLELGKTKKFIESSKIPATTIDDIMKGMGKESLRTGTAMNKFLKAKGWKPHVGFGAHKGEILEDFIKLYGEKKGREEFKFFDDTIRNYFRSETGGVDVMSARFVKEHTVPRELIKLGKVPREYVQRVRAATPLVNAVARHYQGKMIDIVRSGATAAKNENFTEVAKLSGKAKQLATDFKKLTGGYPLPFGITEKGKFKFLDPQPLGIRERGSKFVGPVARLGLEWLDSININNKLIDTFKSSVAEGIPEEKIFDTFGGTAINYLKDAEPYPMTVLEKKLGVAVSKDPEASYKMMEEAFNKDPINFLKNTRPGKAVTRAITATPKGGPNPAFYNKIPIKGGATSELNFKKVLLAIAKKGGLAAIVGTVGLGVYGAIKPATGYTAEPDSGTVDQEPRITDQVAKAPITDEMTYNAIEGKFVKPDGDPETQEGVLNWIADNPIKSALAPIPVGMGVGLGAAEMNAPKVANFFRSMKFMLPPAYAAEKLYQYKEGQDLGEMFTNPLDAVWAMALDTPKSAAGKMDYYKQMASKHKGITSATAIKSQQLGFDPRSWKNIGKATMAPRSFGTSLVFPFAGPKAGAGAAMKVLRGGLRLAPLGPLPMALLAGSMAWDKYKFNKKIGDHIDALRSQGVVNEEDAQTMSTIYKQGWLGTTAIGAKLLGSEELMFEGEMLDIEAQKKILSGMKDFYGEREKVGKEYREGERQEDFFSWFSKGGRVGLAEGGNKPPFGSVTRRGFLKWLVGSITVGVAALTGRGLKQTAKTVATTTTKNIPAKFVGVEGMPEWFFRAVEMFKLKGKLKEMADKDYVQGDQYEMMLNGRKVMMEENPLTGEVSFHWVPDDLGGLSRGIEYKPGQAGFQKFGVDDPEAAAQGISEYRRVKVEEPVFEYNQPDMGSWGPEDTGPDAGEVLDIFTEGDDVVAALEKLAGVKPVVTKETQALEKEAQKKLYKDIQGEEAIIPEPEGVGITDKGDIYGEEQFKEIIEGEVPDHLKKKASGGIIETGNIARRPGAVPPLSGPDPQGSGIVGLFSRPKRVNVAS